MTVPKAMSPNARPNTSMKPMVLCYRGLCTLWCVRLCHWSPVFCATTVLSCGAWACNSATGRFGARGLGSLGLPPVSVLRWVTRYARGAWGCVRCATGRFGQRDSSTAGARRSVWRATRPAAFCRHTGFVDCGWVFFRRQTRVSRPLCTAFAPALWPYEQLQLCSGTVRAARHRGA